MDPRGGGTGGGAQAPRDADRTPRSRPPTSAGPAGRAVPAATPGGPTVTAARTGPDVRAEPVTRAERAVRTEPVRRSEPAARTEPAGSDGAAPGTGGLGGAGATAFADIEAWKARKAYPSTLFAGGPVFGVAREREDGGWELHPYLAGLAPQDARDALAAHLRSRARAAGDAGDERARAAHLAAAGRLDRERLDDVRAGAARYRVVRAERFIRMGPDGPEPPRATDPDPGRGAAGSGDPRACADPAAGLVVAAADAAVGPGVAVLRAELLAALRHKGTVPREVREDSRLAGRTHPGGVLLPATFMATEREGGRWRPHSTGTAATPRDARDGLALHLRVLVPWQQDLTVAEYEVYKRAADHLDEEQCDELDVAGRHFRIVRVERLLRLGPDGPEGPRPSDADHVPPALSGQDDTRSEAPWTRRTAAGSRPDERAARFQLLFAQEQERRRTALREAPDPDARG